MNTDIAFVLIVFNGVMHILWLEISAIIITK